MSVPGRIRKTVLVLDAIEFTGGRSQVSAVAPLADSFMPPVGTGWCASERVEAGAGSFTTITCDGLRIRLGIPPLVGSSVTKMVIVLVPTSDGSWRPSERARSLINAGSAGGIRIQCEVKDLSWKVRIRCR